MNPPARVGNGRSRLAANAGIRLVDARRWLRAEWLAAATCSQRLVKAQRPVSQLPCPECVRARTPAATLLRLAAATAANARPDVTADRTGCERQARRGS